MNEKWVEDSDVSAPKFGEWFRGIYASETNPHRDGMFVRVVNRRSGFNQGIGYMLTDGNGEFWEYPRQSVVRLREREQNAGEAVAPARYHEFAKFYAKLGDVFGRRFPHCRDCADEDGTCPRSGLPCEWPEFPPFTHVFTHAQAVSVPELEKVIQSVEDAELFQDGLAGDLCAAGIEDISDAYMHGRIDAISEIKQAVLASAPTAPAGDGKYSLAETMECLEFIASNGFELYGEDRDRLRAIADKIAPAGDGGFHE